MRSRILARLFAAAAIVAIFAFLRASPSAGDQAIPVSSSVAASAAALEAMARARFGNLTAAELILVHSAAGRAIAWVGPNSDPGSPENNSADAVHWPASRSIRAGIIRWLIAAPETRPYIHPSGVGIAGARIVGELDLTYLKVHSPLTILRCAIADGVDFSNAQLPGIDLRRSFVPSVVGDSSTVNGDVVMLGGDYSEVSLFRTEITGSLDFSEAHLTGDMPLSAVEAFIHGDALFHEGFTTDGVLDFRLAHIGSALSLKGARFVGSNRSGLDAGRARIDGGLYWDDITLTPNTILDLDGTHAGVLWDDAKSWPAAGNLNLDGFVYDDIAGGPDTAGARLRWIGRQAPGYRPQPYSQLARVLRDRGSDIGAVDVMIAKNNDRRRNAGLSIGERVWSWILDVTIGYGYKPLRAVWWIAAFVGVGAILFQWGYQTRAITPIEEGAYQVFVDTGEPPPYYPPFSALVYALDNFLPIVDLHQGNYWRPNPRHGATWASGRLLRWYLWLHILAGWVITPLLAAGLSGLLRGE